MIPFPFNENRFSFFVADYLLVGQLCTNPKCDRSLLSCLKVTQCSTSKIGDVPLCRCSTHTLYRSKLWQPEPLPAPSKCKSRRCNAWGHSSTHRTTLWRWWSGRPHHATSHLRSRLESQHQSVPGCAEECGDPLVQSGGRWKTLGVAAGHAAGPQVQRDPGLASEGVLRFCTLLSLAPLLLRPEPAGLLRLVIRREHHQHDLLQHQSHPDRRYPPSIRWASADARGKGMLPVPDSYRGSDWGWRRLHWINVSSTTKSSYLNWFFQ